MDSDTGNICTRQLAPGERVVLRNAVGCTVMCCAGTVWITQENDARDTILTAGEHFTFDCSGMAIIGALEGMRDAWRGNTGITVISLAKPSPISARR